MDWLEFCQKVASLLQPYRNIVNLNFYADKITYTTRSNEYEYTLSEYTLLCEQSEVYNFSPYAIWSDTSYEMLVNMPDSNLRRFVDIDFSENLTSISIEDFSSQITYSFQKPSKELIWHFIKNYDTNVRIPYRIPAHIFEGRHESLLEKSLIALLNIVIRLPSTLILKSTQPKSKDNFQSRAQSFLFNLAYNYDYVLKPVNEYEDLFPKRISSNRRRLRKLEDMEAPQLSFNQELVEQYYMSLISEDPFVKFIGFYHIMEHFFEDVYNEELLSNVQNIIRHPGFSSKRKKDVAKIIDLIKNKTKQNKEDFSGSELEALELTLKKFINITELNNYLTEYDVTIIDYYKTNEVSFSKGDMIDLRDIANEKLFKKLAARIYKTRNALVHSKSNEGRIRERGIYNPFEDKKQLLMEIPLMRYISETIIINNSQSL